MIQMHIKKNKPDLRRSKHLRMRKGSCTLLVSFVHSRHFEQSCIKMRQASKLACAKVDEKPNRLEKKSIIITQALKLITNSFLIEYYIAQYFSLLVILARALMRPSLGCPQYCDNHILQYFSLLVILARALMRPSLGCPHCCDYQIWLRLHAGK